MTIIDEATTTWWMNVPCKGEPASTFYELDGRGQVRRTGGYKRARSICAACEHRDACLAEAIDIEDYAGFRAGLTPRELQVVGQRRRRRAAHQ